MPDDRTRFRCVVALLEPGGRERVVEGIGEGVIAEATRGTGDFGDDPILYPLLGAPRALLEGER